VRAEELTLGHAKVLLSAKSPEQMLKLANKAMRSKLSVRSLEILIKKEDWGKSSEGLGQFDVSKKLVQSLSAELQKTLGTKVNIEYAKGKGQIEISFYSDDQLTDLVEKIKTGWKQNAKN
jgi:ParB family chromosome partitioning protein